MLQVKSFFAFCELTRTVTGRKVSSDVAMKSHVSIFNFEICDRNSVMLPLNLNLYSSTFTWFYLLTSIWQNEICFIYVIFIFVLCYACFIGLSLEHCSSTWGEPQRDLLVRARLKQQRIWQKLLLNSVLCLTAPMV